MLSSRLGCAPLSPQILESIFRCSESHNKQLMLICSPNQVDRDYGYAFTIADLICEIRRLRKIYPLSNILLCRDHCGPGFSPRLSGVELTKEMVLFDTTNGFDLLHIDLSLLDYDRDQRIAILCELGNLAKSLNPQILFEVCVDNDALSAVDPGSVEWMLQSFQDRVGNLCFYTTPTGSSVVGFSNSSRFYHQRTEILAKIAHSIGVLTKEHNADYLDTQQLSKRAGLIDAFNVAPQLAAAQTAHVVSMAIKYSVDWTAFMNVVSAGNNWRKWLPSEFADQKMMRLIAAGHYHYWSSEYIELLKTLSNYADMDQELLNVSKCVIERYLAYI